MNFTLETFTINCVSESLLSSAQVATLLGVSQASIKRWADAGVLPCVKTAGAHRRFRRESIDRFRAASDHQAPIEPRADSRDAGSWVDELLAGRPSPSLESSLLAARSELGSWWRVAERLGPALTLLGERWENGLITIADEHLASERLARALARIGEWLPRAPDAPNCLLATAEGEEHTLGLSLVELCLRDRGWSPLWIGRSTPIRQLAEAITRYDVRLVALSASRHSRDQRSLARQLELVGRACAAHGVQLVLGGEGAWPARPKHGRVVRDFASFDALLIALTRL